jgi:hypothetical protein
MILICLCTVAKAQTVFDVGLSTNHRVHEFQVGGGYQYRHQPLFSGNGFHYSSACSSIYLVNIFQAHTALIFLTRPMISTLYL